MSLPITNNSDLYINSWSEESMCNMNHKPRKWMNLLITIIKVTPERNSLNNPLQLSLPWRVYILTCLTTSWSAQIRISNSNGTCNYKLSVENTSRQKIPKHNKPPASASGDLSRSEKSIKEISQVIVQIYHRMILSSHK